jgi:hypothetical protein
MPETPYEGRQHQGDGIAAGRDGQPWKRYAGDRGVRCCGVRHPRRRRCVEVHDPRNKRHWFVLQLLNSDTAYFEKTGKSGRWPRNQPVMDGFDKNTIVRHQTCEDEQAARCGVKEVEHEPRFAGAGRSANEDSPRASEDRRGVDGGDGLHSAYIAGSRTRKRAPRTRSSAAPSPGSRGATRFCASSLPSCASTICFEIDKPSPEF